jgi:hypothetical protein
MNVDTVEHTSAVSKLAHEISRLGFKASDYAEDINAANWVLAALDPADSAGQTGAVLGIPDHMDQPSTVIAWRQIDSIAPAVDLGLTDSSTWDMDMLTFEGPYILAAGQMRNSADHTKFKNFWITNQMFNFNPSNPGPGPALHTDNDTGNISVVGSGIQTNWQQNVAFYRPTHAAMTVEFVGATLTDQGTIVAAQQPNQWTLSPMSNVNVQVPEVTGLTLLQTSGQSTSVSLAEFGTASSLNTQTGLQQSSSVPTFDTLLMVAPGSRSWKASKGAYMPLRYQQPSLNFLNTTAVGEVPIIFHPWNTNGTNHGLVSPPSTDALPEHYTAAGGIGDGEPIVGTISRLMRAGAVCIRGVAPTTTFSCVTRAGYELLPPPAGPWSANLTPSCKPCDRAVEAYFRMRHDLPDVFESSWNRMGTLSKVVGKVAGAVFGSPKSAGSEGEQKDKSRGIKKMVSRVISPTANAAETSESKRPIMAAVQARRAKKAK